MDERIRELLKPSSTRLIGKPEHCLASPEQADELQPFCWDTNCFYRRLGLQPGAPRIEVARAYQEMDGHRSSRLTAAATTLINRHTKAAYDRTPLGSFWAIDEDLDGARTTGELIEGDEDDWAYYVSDVPDGFEPTPEMIATALAAITIALWRAGCSLPFALGFSPRRRVEIIGKRIVAFIPSQALTVQEARYYSSLVASQIVDLEREAEASGRR